jgi:uncharacterized membrane protein YfcA
MPIINYDLAAIMEPTTLIGTVIGVMLNHILPNWLILLKLVTLLAFITYHTFLKGRAVRYIVGLLCVREGLRADSILPDS